MARHAFLLALAVTAVLPAGAAAQDATPLPGTGEVIVRYDASSTPGERREARAAVDATIDRTLPLPRVQVLTVDPGDEASAARALARADGVAWAEPNARVQASRIPDDPRWPDLWGLASIAAPQAWDRSTGSSGVVVAVVDTGVAVGHPDLQGSRWTNLEEPVNGIDDDGNGLVDDRHGWDWVDDDRDPVDAEGHGTHVAGTIAARGNDGIGVAGVSWGAQIMPLRVLGPTGGTLADVAAGFTYAAQQGAQVVNASLGANGSSSALTAAVQAAPQTLFVVAAGNGGSDGIGDDVAVSPQTPCTITAANLLCVAATSSGDALASFSNRGATQVHLAGPGVAILSTLPTFAEPFTEDFETEVPGRWASGGTTPAWARTVAGGSTKLLDSPAGSYGPNADSWARIDGLDLRAGTGCALRYGVNLDLDSAQDTLRIEAATDPAGPFTMLSSWTGRGSATLTASLDAYAGAAALSVRFRLVTDATGSGDGVALDNLRLRCTATGAPPEWTSWSGTSMATPHVAGAAALVWGVLPAPTVSTVRAALLDGTDARASLTGKVASGGRLNVAGALAVALGPMPDTTITAEAGTLVFTSTVTDSTFRCRIDEGAWVACTSPYTLPGLAPGAHRVTVAATTPTGVDELDPAQHLWTVASPPPVVVVPPAVPSLKPAPPRAGGDDPDETFPRPAITVVPGQSLAAVLRRGVVVTAACPDDCTVMARPLVGGRSAGRLRTWVLEPGTTDAVVPLSVAAKRLLRRARRPVVVVRATVAAAAGAAKVTGRVTLAR